MRPSIARLLMTALLLVPAGCAAGKADLAGKVTHRGKAVGFGTVIVRGPDGLDVPGTIDPDGSYRVSGVAAGPAKIAVVSRDPGPATAAKGRAPSRNKSRDAEEPLPGGDRARWFPIPEKYEDPTQSGLGTTLKAGSNTHDIDLP